MGRVLKDGPKIGEVAAAAGVSRATVSRVMNGQSTVAPDIADRVREAAAELNYRPSTLARSLSLGRSSTVAVVVPDLRNPMFHQVLRGVMDASEAEDYRTLVAETADRTADESAVAQEARARCDAVILVNPRMPQEALEELLPQLRPVVLVNRTTAHEDIPSLVIDHAQGIHRLVDHLAGLGHRHLAYLRGPAGSISDIPRREALADAVARRPELRVDHLAGGSTIDAGFEAADQVLASEATAVVAFNDLTAFGLLARLNESGVRVPDGLSVTGFDDIELARFANPALTTVNVPHAELGRRAWQLLAEVVAGGPVPASGRTPETFVPELTVRTSTGPVPPPRALTAPSTDLSGRAHRHADDDGGPRWSARGASWQLELGELVLAHSMGGERMPTVHSPRPHLHPVRSLRGRLLTDRSPDDHRHHYGVSLTIPDVDGTTYWGGRTFDPEHGPMLLPNHGHQHVDHAQMLHRGATLRQEIRWIDQDQRPQLHEQREVTGAGLEETEAWALRWSSALRAEHALTISSPAVRGRPGAGYGGFFWRLASGDEVEVLNSAGAQDIHGAPARWVSVAVRHSEDWTSLVLAQQSADPVPWFVRASDYIGLGPALAWDAPLELASGEVYPVEMLAVVVDRRVNADEVDRLLELGEGRVQAARSA